MPPLIALLEAKENEADRELLRQEVEAMRDNATAIELPTEIAKDMTKSRGYQDINAERVWNEWLTLKTINHEKYRRVTCRTSQNR
ncbi:hypothetical protein RIN58_07835 [Siccibacter colletis]|nr:hypothetical protein [Siccibacter colletis]WNN50449.1 hypothetical protein RIN58_07835 [Siccibacter colletis]